MPSFFEKLTVSVNKNDSLLCVGLDSDTSKLPAEQSQFEFNKAIIDATHDLVCAYKPNTAFYEAEGVAGIEALKATCDYINQTYPEIPIILDAKRADIGNTNLGYVKFAYDYLGVDSITLHPYLGSEAIQPFLDRADKATIILCRTSNPGAGEIQDQLVDGKPLYELVARKVADEWNANNNCMLVVGATYPNELARIRSIVGEDMWLLVPGMGTQGGDVSQMVPAGINAEGTGIIVNSSREVIFAASDETFADAARQKATELRDTINTYRKRS
jgi:orotidine-5'-phosphate decarboxylase